MFGLWRRPFYFVGRLWPVPVELRELTGVPCLEERHPDSSQSILALFPPFRAPPLRPETSLWAVGTSKVYLPVHVWSALSYFPFEGVLCILRTKTLDSEVRLRS